MNYIAHCRFAPTPSGALHIGSARTFLAAYLQAKSLDAQLTLRIEDLDITRARPGATERMIDDLRWLGLAWDQGPDGGSSHPYYQSQRAPLYLEALQQLRAKGLAYPCVCSRREVASASQAPHQPEPIYPRTCASKDPEQVLHEAEKVGRSVAWRFRASATLQSFEDSVFGTVLENVAEQVGDFVIYRSDGVAAYQLAVVVDDILMGISQVLRGSDLLASTCRQLLLYQAFGASPPQWAHIGLVLNDDHTRLAKRDGGLSITTLREHNADPQWLMQQLAHSLGATSVNDRHWRPSAALQRPVTLSELGLRNGDPDSARKLV